MAVALDVLGVAGVGFDVLGGRGEVFGGGNGVFGGRVIDFA